MAKRIVVNPNKTFLDKKEKYCKICSELLDEQGICDECMRRGIKDDE